MSLDGDTVKSINSSAYSFAREPRRACPTIPVLRACRRSLLPRKIARQPLTKLARSLQCLTMSACGTPYLPGRGVPRTGPLATQFSSASIRECAFRGGRETTPFFWPGAANGEAANPRPPTLLVAGFAVVEGGHASAIDRDDGTRHK
jgi:hypothetical protein